MGSEVHLSNDSGLETNGAYSRVLLPVPDCLPPTSLPTQAKSSGLPVSIVRAWGYSQVAAAGAGGDEGLSAGVTVKPLGVLSPAAASSKAQVKNNTPPTHPPTHLSGPPPRAPFKKAST